MNILNSSHSDANRLHYGYYYTITQQEHKGVQENVQEKVCFTLNFKNDFLIKYFKEILQKDIDERILKGALHENIYFQNHISIHNPFPKTHLQTTMSKRTSQADMKGKGKALAVQPKQFQKPLVRILDRHEGISIETISLQDMLLAEAMYSCGENSEIL